MKICQSIFWENLKHGYAIWHFIRYERIADFVNDTDCKYLLDVGCGIGLLDPLIANKYIVGVDIDRKNIVEAKRIRKTTKLDHNAIHNVVADLHFLPFREKFDAIICSEVLEHLTHDKAALAALLTLLKEGGLLLMTLPNAIRLEFSQLFRLTLRQKRMHPTHVREYKVNDAYCLVRAFPLRMEKITGVYFDFPLFHVFSPPIRIPLCLHLSPKFRFFVYNALHQVYTKLWMPVESLFWHHAYYILAVLKKVHLESNRVGVF
jgi:SAM-dependent methyltransferase